MLQRFVALLVAVIDRLQSSGTLSLSLELM